MPFVELKRASRYPGEYAVLLGFIIALPLLEAPKNLLWLAYTITWVVNRIRHRDFGGRWDLWDSLIAAWIVSGYVVAAFAGLHNSEWSGANDILRYGAVLWLVKRSGYHRGALQWLLVTVAVSTLISVAFALWSLYVTHTRQQFELNSVGHINHSSVYLAISYGALLCALLAFWRRLNTAWRWLGILATSVFAGIVFFAASRAAVGVMLLLTGIVGWVWAQRSRYMLAALVGLAVAAGSIAYVAKLEVVQKQLRNAEENNVLSYRGQIWNTALAAWNKFPLFGVGMHNFNQISTERVKQWVQESGRPFDASQYRGTSHAHSLYLNTLAERGLVGLAVLSAVLVAWLYWLLRFLPKAGDEELGWALWGASFSAWFASAGIGLVNTTLHHEHGLLSALLLGLWLAYLKLPRTGSADQPGRAR